MRRLDEPRMIDPEHKAAIAKDIQEVGAISVGGIAIWHITPENFAAIATGIYFSVMALYQIWKWIKEWRKSKKD